MRAPPAIILALILGSCGGRGETVESFAADREAADAAVARCDAGHRTHGCDITRRGLAEARRRERQDLYGELIEAP